MLFRETFSQLKLNDLDMNKVGVIILTCFLHNSIFRCADFHMFYLRFF